MEVLARRDVWPRMTSLAKRARSGERQAAVAYVGAGAFEMLPMGKGDTLVVDCSPVTAAAGSTNPVEVRRYLDAGVYVYRWDGLHAKAYVFGDTAVVGSANASVHSRDDLDEAVAIVTTKSGVKAVRRLIDSLCIAAVDEEWLELCQSKWRPPRRLPRREHIEDWSPLPADHSAWRLWVIESTDVTWPGYIEDAVVQHDSGVRARESGPYRLETMLWDGRPPFRTGDVVVVCHYHHEGPERAYPPARVEQAWKVRRGRSERTLVTLMRPRALRPIAASKLKGATAGGGWRLRTASAQQARTPEHRRVVLELWPQLLQGKELT